MRALFAGLTIRGKSFLAAGVAAGAFGLGLGERALLSIGIVLLALPLLAALATSRARYRIRCARRISPPRVPAGHNAVVSLRLENISRLPTGLLLAEDALPYSLGTRPRFVLERIEQGGWRELTYPIQSGSRGKYTVGPLQVRVADAFGLVELTRSFAARSTLVVTPAIIPLPSMPLAGNWRGEGGGHTRTADTAGEDDVIPRPYRDGDELRRVHWRSTARHGELMVRREEQRWRNRAVLLLDTRARAHSGAGAGSSFEYAASAIASIGVHLARSGIDGHLVTDTGPATAPGSFEDSLLDSLAVIRQSSGSGLAGGMDLTPGGTGGLFVVVAGRLSAEEASRLAAGRRDAGPAMALLLAVSTWAGRRGGRQPGGRDGRPRGNPPRGGVAGHHDHRRHPAHHGLGTAARLLHAPRRTRARAGQLPGRGRPVSQRLTVAAAVAALAASLSLYPLVSGWLWFWEGAGAIAVVALAGALTRLRVLPWLLCAPIGLIALLLYVNVLFSSAHSLGGIIPTRRFPAPPVVTGPGGAGRDREVRAACPGRPRDPAAHRARHRPGGGGHRPARGTAAPAGCGRAAVAGAVLRAPHHHRA